jgi:hypothetical protein
MAIANQNPELSDSLSGCEQKIKGIDREAACLSSVLVEVMRLGARINVLLREQSRESITRPNQGAVQWANLLHHEGFPLNPSLKHAARTQSPCDQVLSEPLHLNT